MSKVKRYCVRETERGEEAFSIHCRPDEMPAAFKGYRNVPINRLVFVDDGANPTGDVCAGQHWHGFVRMEKEPVNLIGSWIKNPTN